MSPPTDPTHHNTFPKQNIQTPFTRIRKIPIKKIHNILNFNNHKKGTEAKQITTGRVRGLDGDEIPLLPIRIGRSCLGNCKGDDEKSLEEGEEEEKAKGVGR